MDVVMFGFVQVVYMFLFQYIVVVLVQFVVVSRGTHH